MASKHLQCLKFLIIFSLVVQVVAFRTPFDFSVKKAPRFNIPFLGIGVKCNGCPVHTCDADLSVIFGYCCGCARFLDRLPILCPRYLECPLNGAGLCSDYEYMLRCCC